MTSSLETRACALALGVLLYAGDIAAAQIRFPDKLCKSVGEIVEVNVSTGQGPVTTSPGPTADRNWMLVSSSSPQRSNSYVVPPLIDTDANRTWHDPCFKGRRANWIQTASANGGGSGPCRGATGTRTCPGKKPCASGTTAGPGPAITAPRSSAQYQVDIILPADVARVFPDIKLSGTFAANDNVRLELNTIQMNSCSSVPEGAGVPDGADEPPIVQTRCHRAADIIRHGFSARLTDGSGGARLVAGTNTLTAHVYNHRGYSGLLVRSEVNATCTCAAVHGVGSPQCPP